MSNSIYDADFVRTLPTVLQNDETMLALAKCISDELRKNALYSELAVIYPRIDYISEELLDVIAYDLHIDWYEYDSPIDVKRELVKQSVKVHKTLGTKFAIENVIRAYFGDGEVREWFEYGGEPGYFKIISSNPSVTNEQIDKFLSILDVVKRKSSWLESILITLTGEMNLYAGIAYRESTREIHEIKGVTV